MYKCKFCEKECIDLGILQTHLKRKHKLSNEEIEEYYIKYYKKDGEGIDPITGGKTEFIGMKRGYKKFEKNNHKKFATNTIEHYMINGLSFEDAKKRVEYTNNKSSEYLKSDWKKHKELGTTRGGWSKKHFLELGYSDIESELEVKKRAEQREKKMCQHRKYAKITGKYKLYSPTCIEYYLNKGLSEDDAKKELKKRQATNTIENYIKKYGEIDGVIKFKERNHNWSLEMERKYHNGEYNRDSNKNGKGIQNRCFSNKEKDLSISLFNILNKKINDFKFMSICTGTHEQYYIFDSGKYYFYDIVFMYNGKRKIIEFNGDYWHMNPAIYNENDYNNSLKLKSKEIWNLFNHKLDIAKNKNFQTHIVWEMDWDKNKEDVINECINFLLND